MTKRILHSKGKLEEIARKYKENERTKVIKETYNNAINRGDKNVYFIYPHNGANVIMKDKITNLVGELDVTLDKLYKGDKIYVDTTFMSKGSTGIKGSASELGRRRAINNIRKQNKKKSRVNGFDEFYFDFDYKDEEYKRRYKRKER